MVGHCKYSCMFQPFVKHAVAYSVKTISLVNSRTWSQSISGLSVNRLIRLISPARLSCIVLLIQYVGRAAMNQLVMWLQPLKHLHNHPRRHYVNASMRARCNADQLTNFRRNKRQAVMLVLGLGLGPSKIQVLGLGLDASSPWPWPCANKSFWPWPWWWSLASASRPLNAFTSLCIVTDAHDSNSHVGNVIKIPHFTYLQYLYCCQTHFKLLGCWFECILDAAASSRLW